MPTDLQTKQGAARQGEVRFKRPAGAKPVGTWKRKCGYCGNTTQVVTDGRMLLCSVCGH